MNRSDFRFVTNCHVANRARQWGLLTLTLTHVGKVISPCEDLIVSGNDSLERGKVFLLDKWFCGDEFDR